MQTMQSTAQVPVFILAGGLGTRFSEETHLKPKPMIEVGDIPILVHIMRWYYRHGFNDFVICAGYRSWEIKQYFLDYEYRLNHLGIDHRENLNQAPKVIGVNTAQEKWRVRVIDTGQETLTGGRVARALQEVSKTDSFENFAVTYGDGVTDADLSGEFNFHRDHGRIGTVLGVKPSARFGELDVVSEGKHKGLVEGFLEKPESRQGLINGGFFFFKREFEKYLSTEVSCMLERKPIEKLANDQGLMMFPHDGFWYPMDTQRDKTFLNELWLQGKAPWKP